MYLDNGRLRSVFLCNFPQRLPTKATGVLSLLLGALWRLASPVFSRPIPLTILLAGSLWLGVGSAFAQPCALRAEVLSHLENKYQEAPIAIGLTNGGGIVELLSADGGKTWTLIVTNPNGMTCLIAAGESWESVRLGIPS